MSRAGRVWGFAVAAVAVVIAFGAFGPVAAAGVAWLLASPDAVASTARAGGAGAVVAAGRAGWGSLAQEWRSGGPGRRRRRTARRDRWWAAGGWRRRLLRAEHVLVVSWRVPATVLAALAGALAAIPAGARAGAEKARSRRRGDPADPYDDDVDQDDQDDQDGDGGGADPDPRRRRRTWWSPPDSGPLDDVPIGEDPDASDRQDDDDDQGDAVPDAEDPHEADPDADPAGGRPGPAPDSGGRPAAGDTTDDTPTGDDMPENDTHGSAGSGELTTTSDLRAEVEQVAGWIEEAEVMAGLLRDWQEHLGDDYAGGEVKTRALGEAVRGLGESGGDAVAYGEGLGQIRRACDQADSLGEQAVSMAAAGHTSGYVPA